MNFKQPDIKPYSECALLIEWESRIDAELLNHVLSVKKKLLQHYPKETTEIINTYHTLLLHFKTAPKNRHNEITHLKALLTASSDNSAPTSFCFHLPVCYDEKYSLDMEHLENVRKLSREQIIQLHTEPDYLLYFIGFLPGFLYLGGLNPQLHIPRRKAPRKRIIKGAVGIGGGQTGIYPQNSPGGWQIIGNGPVPLFDANKNPPSPFRAGDRVRFYAISEEEHQDISNRISKNEYALKKEPYGNQSN